MTSILWATLLACVPLISCKYPIQHSYHEVPMHDGIKLVTSLWTPQSNATDKFPLILLPTSWALPLIEYFIDDFGLAASGYVCVSYCERGWWESGGRIGTAGPLDMADITTLIDWALKTEPKIDKDMIGMSGISYGGGLSLLGAAHDMRIRSVVPMSGWPSLLDALWPGQSPSIVQAEMLNVLASVPGMARPPVGNESLSRLLENLVLHRDVPATIAWAEVRGAATYLDILNSRAHNLSVYISNNLEDQIFPPNFMLDDFWPRLTIPNKRIDLNQGWHALAELGTVGDGYIWHKAMLWFDHFLKGKQNGITDLPPVNIQLLTDHPKDSIRIPMSRWPDPSAVTNIKYYFGYRGTSRFGTLTTTAPTKPDTDRIEFGLESGLNCGVPDVSEIIQEIRFKPIYNTVGNSSHDHAVVYLTDPFPKRRMLLGSPVVTITVTPNRKDFQVNAYMYAVNGSQPKGQEKGLLLSYGTVSTWSGTADKPVKATIKMFTCGYDVPAGTQIAVGLNLFNVLYTTPNYGLQYHVDVGYGLGLSDVTLPLRNA